MSATYITKDGDTLDYICWKFYAQQSGAVEQVLDANPGLANKGPIFDGGIEIALPEIQTKTTVQTISLWD